MNPVHENIPNGLNKSGNSEISYGFQTATDIGNSLDKLPWDILLWRQDLDLYSRLVIRKEIIRRCPEFEAKLNANHWNLIHLASEYGYVEIVKVLISKSTGAVPGNMSQLLLRSDVYHQMTPLHYAAMKGNMQVLQLLLDAVTTSGTYVQDQLMTVIFISIRENQLQAFRALAIKYMEKWNSNKVAIIKTTNKLLMETPRPSDDIPAEVFEALNTKLLSAVKTTSQSWWKEHSLLEKFLASDPLLFRALSSRSCPMQTQYYCCLLTRQTDDLLDEMQKSRDEVGPDEGPDRVNIYPMHWVITTKFFHIAKLLLIYESGSSSLCLLKDMQGDTPLHCAAQRGEVSFIDILLSTCWECAGVVSDNKNETALHCAFRNNQAKAFKTLLGWYIIKEEILNNNAGDWECEDTSLDLLVDGYVNIVKELLCQSESKVCFQREFWEGKDYFVVIKCKSKESIGTSFKYQDYIREVSSKTTNRIILSLSVDSRSIITLKVLIRSVMVRGILDVKDVYRYTVLDLLDMWPEPEDMRKKTNLMGFVLYERYENVIWLLDAIQMGDYEAFSKLQVEDPQILDHVCEFPLGGTPLHIAVRVGQLNDCTREIIRKRPEFAATKDNKGRIPLHIASAKGYLEIVKELLTQLGFNQCFSSAHLVYKQDFYIDGEFYGTPIEYAIEKGRISVINELLSVWWKCVRVVNREANSELLKIAVACKQLEAMKMLMERYIEDELLKAKEVDGNPMSALADGYIEIVLKHLLSPKVNYSLSILMKNRMGKYPPLPLYFAVIKVTSRSRRKENNIIDELQLSAYYPKYFREVTVRNKMVLHLSVDNGNSVTLKLLLRSPLFYEIDDLFGATIFQRLWDKLEIKVVENEMGTLLPIWSNKISYAKEQLGEEGAKDGDEGVVADGNEEQFSLAAKNYEHVLENDNKYQEMLSDIDIPDRVDGYTIRSEDRISLWIGQRFASLEECRNAIKDAAILCKTEVTFTKSTSERIVAECSKILSCKWKIRAKVKSNSNIYVVTEIANKHTCPRLNGITNKLATPKWISNHIIEKVRQDHNISTHKIRDIIKSQYQIDISCKAAERAKKRALDTIHESQIVSNTRRKNLIASSTFSSNAHLSWSNVSFLEQIPEPMHEYIHSTVDVEKDGHCGYRVVAMQLGYEAMHGWKQVRTELLYEVVQNEELYVRLTNTDRVARMRKAFAYLEDHADHRYWLSLHDAGYVIANAYKAVVVSLSLYFGNLTFLPLLEPPPEDRPHRIIAFGFVDGNHFISISLKPDAPIPQVNNHWDTHVSKAAEVWKTPYLNRFDKFKTIMGCNLGQRDQNCIGGVVAL